jgi:hypothetical protein
MSRQPFPSTGGRARRRAWAIGVCLVACVAGSRGTPTRAVEPAAAPPGGGLASREQEVAQQFRDLEKTFLRLADLLAPSDPRRAALLRSVFAQARDAEVGQRLDTIVELLQKGQLLKAGATQATALEQLRELLTLLESGDSDKRLASAKEEVRQFVGRLSKLIARQRDVQGSTESGAGESQLSERQSALAEEARGLAEEIGGFAQRMEPKDAAGDRRADGNQGDMSPGTDDEKSPGDGRGGEKNRGGGEPGERGRSDSKDGSKDGSKNPANDSQQDREQGGRDTPGKNDEGKKGGGTQEAGERDGTKNEGGQPPGKSAGGKAGDGGDSGGDEQPTDESQQADDGGRDGGDDESSRARRAKKRLADAERRMRQAQERLRDANRRQARDEQEKAIEELETARAELEEILRQMREEEVERLLVQLEARLRAMLRAERAVLAGAEKLAVEQDRADRERELEAARLSREQGGIGMDASRALSLVRDDGSAVAIPEALEQVREDSSQAAARLARGDVGGTTRGILQDLVSNLEEMVAALEKAQREQEARQSGGPEGRPAEPGEQPLVDKLSELKMIRSLQLRVNGRTRRFSKLLADGAEQAEEPELLDALERLAERQRTIERAAHDIVTGRAE